MSVYISDLYRLTRSLKFIDYKVVFLKPFLAFFSYLPKFLLNEVMNNSPTNRIARSNTNIVLLSYFYVQNISYTYGVFIEYQIQMLIHMRACTFQGTFRSFPIIKC